MKKETGREGRAERKTTEVAISVKIKIDGRGLADVKTTINFLDHLLVSLAKHSRFDLTIRAEGDLNHHICEDVALTLGNALNQALKNRKGINRFGFACIPMDDALARAAIDIGGRSYSYLDLQFIHSKIEDLATEDITHFFESFAQTSKSNVHLTILSGRNDHHKAEATMKALAIALKEAVCYDPKREGEIPSTKGVI